MVRTIGVKTRDRHRYLNPNLVASHNITPSTTQARLLQRLGRIKHNYNVGDRILLRTPGLRQKLAAPKEGLYTILEVGTNGTVKIQRGIVHECVTIRIIEPFFEHLKQMSK
jgi:hypothetical protein